MFRLIAFGKLSKNVELNKLFHYYYKMLKTKWQIIEFDIKESSDPKSIKKKEFELLLSKIKSNDINVLLTEYGKAYNSLEFSKFMNSISSNSSNVNFIISGAYGFDENAMSLAHHQISLSKLTFPHLVTRVILIEQLYRAETIMNNHPYHK